MTCFTSRKNSKKLYNLLTPPRLYARSQPLCNTALSALVSEGEDKIEHQMALTGHVV